MAKSTRREHLTRLGAAPSVFTAACKSLRSLQGSPLEAAPVRPEYPHFGKDGSLITKYDSNKSIFARTLFQLNFDDLAEDPRLAEELERAGINTITTGLYSNPVDSHSPDYESWYEGWSGYWRNVELNSNRLGMSLLLTGDDIMRESYQMANSLTGSWSARALRTALETARQSNRVLGVEMMDEVVGDSIPPDFLKLMSIINTARIRPLLTWPAVSGSSTAAVARWMGNPEMSDYSSVYWSLPNGTDRSLEAYRTTMAHTVRRWRPFLQQNRPMVLLVSVAGEFYTKRVPGGDYAPGQDHLQGKPNTPLAIAVQIMYAAIAGAAGVRLYLYDGPHLRKERADSPIGRSDLQTGSAPGSARWEALAGALNLIKALEPYLLQATIPAPDLGPEVIMSVRSGPDSVLVLALNFSSRSVTRSVDLSPYRRKNLKVYRLLDREARVTSDPNSWPQHIQFQPGETVAWLFFA
jgi:hypothetical protein